MSSKKLEIDEGEGKIESWPGDKDDVCAEKEDDRVCDEEAKVKKESDQRILALKKDSFSFGSISSLGNHG